MSAQAYLDALPLPVLLIGQNERVAAANAPARALLGAALAGGHFINALRQPALLDAIEACLSDRAPREAEYLTRDGDQDTTYFATVRPVPLEAGGTGVLVCFQDVSHLQQLDHMRRDFVANVSHELRTPLTAIMGFIETLKGPAQGDAPARLRFLEIMEREAARMNRLVGDLLSLSRVEQEQRVRPTGRLDPAELISDTVRGLSQVARDAGVTLECQLPDTPCKITGDADQLRQVLTNLIENAIKYSGQGAAVTIRLSPPEYRPRLRCEGIRIDVQDSGPGIDPLHLPRLTERFYRVDSHRSREKGGTGLGLAIVKHIVSRHRGRLSIDSAPGRGSCFSVVLPVE
ncbi:sensor histidine kinase [Tropicibacter oceani]|uniref:histidine kinase n=1 Tax=Tropicibacter oceani TaxID=3058420 RepID=A0ABY8QEK8_9RHOB|nr:ATP-binding protein [Tropicibacter oceani]WGW02878.1 ATP-binding protein [Tropicibacter oceani]